MASDHTAQPTSPHVVLVHGWAGSFEATWQRNGFSALLEDGGAALGPTMEAGHVLYGWLVLA
ncbi:MAG: hypothetical protein AAGG08_09095, partial [Actinomycetota bacterium]